jgi:hypothetical protein
MEKSTTNKVEKSLLLTETHKIKEELDEKG